MKRTKFDTINCVKTQHSSKKDKSGQSLWVCILNQWQNDNKHTCKSLQVVMFVLPVALISIGSENFKSRIPSRR